MRVMRRLSSEWRLQGLSVKEIAGPFESVAGKLCEEGHKFKGRKLKAGPLLNALVLWFLRLPEDERERFAVRALAQLEGFLAETDQERAEAQVRLQRASEPAKGYMGQQVTPKPKRKRDTAG